MPALPQETLERCRPFARLTESWKSNTMKKSGPLRSETVWG